VAVQDRAGGVDLIRHVRALFPRIGIIVANSAYAGRFDRAGGPMVGCPGCRRPDLASAFVLLSTRRCVSSKRSEPGGSAYACSSITNPCHTSPRA
jgi:hypothetical protein